MCSSPRLMVAEDPLRVAAGFSLPRTEAVRSRPCTQHQGKRARPKGTFPNYKDVFFRKRLLSRGQILFQRQSVEAGQAGSKVQMDEMDEMASQDTLEFSSSTIRFFFLPPFL